MFTRKELVSIQAALKVQQASVTRLAAKEGQPDSVAAEYRKVSGEIADLQRKVQVEVDKLPAGK